MQRQRLPSKCCSTWYGVGLGFASSRADMFTTHPGVQYPHWLPFPSAIASCTSLNPAASEPRPSTVVMARPSHAHRSRKHALIGTAAASSEPMGLTVTVHAPHPPSPHPIYRNRRLTAV